MAGGSYPIEMVRGVPVVAAPAEIDDGNADWLRSVLLEAACRGDGARPPADGLVYVLLIAAAVTASTGAAGPGALHTSRWRR